MKINEIIRERRIAKGLTQEQVAACLGVSAPAVNKWEKSSCYPDITLLPAIARLLDTDLNTLLSFKEELSRQEIGSFLNEIVQEAGENGVEHAFARTMEKVREYPSCDLLLLNAALTLEGLLAMCAEDGDFSGQRAAVEKLYERAAQSADRQVSDHARSMLVSSYLQRQEYQKAEQLLSKLPDEAQFDKKLLQANLLVRQEKWEEAAQLLERKLLSETSSVQSTLLTLMEIACRQGRESDAEQIAGVAEQMTGLFGLWEYVSHAAVFQLAMLQKDTPKCLEALKKMLPAMLQKWDISQSPLYRHMLKKGGGECLGEMMLPKILSEFEDPDCHEYDFLRSHPDFQKTIADFKESFQNRERAPVPGGKKAVSTRE